MKHIRKYIMEDFKLIDSGYAWSEIEHIALFGAMWMAKELCNYGNPTRCEMENHQECRACQLSSELGGGE